MNEVKMLPYSEADEWLSIRGLRSVQALLGSTLEVEFPLPDKALRRGALAFDLAAELASSGETLITVFDKNIWNGSECEFIFERFVQTGISSNQTELLSGENPALLTSSESYLVGVLSMCFYFSWGFLAVDYQKRIVATTNHEDWFSVTSNPKELGSSLLKSYGPDS